MHLNEDGEQLPEQETNDHITEENETKSGLASNGLLTGEDTAHFNLQSLNIMED